MRQPDRSKILGGHQRRAWSMIRQASYTGRFLEMFIFTEIWKCIVFGVSGAFTDNLLHTFREIVSDNAVAS